MTQIKRQAAKEIFPSSSSPFVGGTIVVTDCTHVSIMSPRDHEEAYVNHHGYHSINVQMICDSYLKILAANAKYPGARHDSFIWSSSTVRRVMQRCFESGNHNMFLIGDSGYPLEPEGSPKLRYNEALCKARNPVERLFGVLIRTWRCLSQQRTLLYDAGFTGRIVNACSVLHNIRLGDQIYEIEQEFLERRINTVNTIHEAPSSTAKRIQDC